MRRAAIGDRKFKLARFIALIVFLLLAVMATVRIWGGRGVSSRTTILLATSPMELWSWDREENSFILVLFPADVVVDAVGGYGKYSLASLWKLGFIDKKEGNLLANTLANTIALPVPWFLGKDRGSIPVVPDPVAYAKSVFSAGGFFPYAFSRVQTNIPLSHYISFAYALSRARPDAIVTYDLTRRLVTSREILADGSTQEVVDIEKLDVVLKGIFESETIRKERQTVAVYNTTTTPFLGTQAARVLTNVGVLVVAVGNEEKQTDTCVLSGQKDALSTKTAHLIRELFSCEPQEANESERADLLVRLGTEYAQTFLLGEPRTP